MSTLCRECGKPSTPEYTDEHDGLCMFCAHPIIRPVVMSESEKQFSAEVEEQAMALCESMNIRYHDNMPDIDHDMVQPAADDQQHRDRYSYHLDMAMPNTGVHWMTGVTRVYVGDLPSVDHDQVMASANTLKVDDDPIRDAIDRACVDLFRGKP